MDKMEELVKSEVKRTFNPEFLNRLDEIIIFTSLSDADLMQILELLVQQLNANLVHKAITISVTDDAKKWILDKTLRPHVWGAASAPGSAALVEDPLSEALIAGGIVAAAGRSSRSTGEQPALLPARVTDGEEAAATEVFCSSG